MKIPFFAFYPDNWLSSQQVRSMTEAEKGLYFHLLCLQWIRQPECFLPPTVEEIAALIPSRSYKKITKILQKCFKNSPKGYQNERLFAEFLRAKTLHERACKAAKKRWNCHNEEGNKHTRKHTVKHSISIPTSTGELELELEESKEESKHKYIGEKSKKRFSPPTLNDVTEYCIERKNNVNPQGFLDHYSANGWRVGKNPMRDWRAAVRTWERNDYGLQASGGRGPRTFAKQRELEQQEQAERLLKLRRRILGNPGATSDSRAAADTSRGTVLDGEACEVPGMETE